MQKQSGPAPSRRSACAAQLLPSRCVIDPSLRLSAHFCHSASLHHARQRHMADILVGMIDWFVVMTDDRSIGLSVIPPGRSPRQAVIPWDSVVRVCFEAADFLVSDDLYIFTSLRPESWLIPTEADGGRQGLANAEAQFRHTICTGIGPDRSAHRRRYGRCQVTWSFRLGRAAQVDLLLVPALG